MLRRGSLGLPHGTHELPPVQMPQRRLHAALRQPRVIGDGLMTHAHALRPAAVRPLPQVQIHDERRRRFVMADQIAEECLQDVMIEADCLDIRYSAYDYSSQADR